MTAEQGTVATPEPLEQPQRAELRLESVMAALADPIRLTIVQRLLGEEPGVDRACAWIGINRPKSTLTHHFRALRDAGLIEQRQYGTERRNRIRRDDIDAVFPGLLAMVGAWPGASIPQPEQDGAESGVAATA